MKAEHQVPYGLLNPIPVPQWKWDNIAMDFVPSLPLMQKKHDSVWVIVDRLMKSVAPPYPTQLGGRTRSGDADQFYQIYIFEYCRNICRIIILVKEGPPFCQLTLSFNMACMPF